MKDGSFSYDGLDRVLHERARLSILTALSTAARGQSFGDLKRLCDLTDGNLNRHLKVLDEAEMVTITKRGGGRGSETRIEMSPTGRQSFVAYLEELERVLMDARGAAEPTREPEPEGGSGRAALT